MGLCWRLYRRKALIIVDAPTAQVVDFADDRAAERFQALINMLYSFDLRLIERRRGGLVNLIYG